MLTAPNTRPSARSGPRLALIAALLLGASAAPTFAQKSDGASTEKTPQRSSEKPSRAGQRDAIGTASVTRDVPAGKGVPKQAAASLRTQRLPMSSWVRLARKLELSEPQRLAVEAYLARFEEDRRAYRDRMAPQMTALAAEIRVLREKRDPAVVAKIKEIRLLAAGAPKDEPVRLAIAGVLTREQRVAFDESIARALAEMRERQAAARKAAAERARGTAGTGRSAPARDAATTPKRGTSSTSASPTRSKGN